MTEHDPLNRELPRSPVQTGVFCGDFTVMRTVLLGVIPQDALSGGQVRALHVLAAETQAPDPYNHWVLQLGVLEGGKFRQAAPEVSLAGGLVANVGREIAYQDAVIFPKGSRVALRPVPTGNAPPLAGLSVVVEWSILSARRSSRV